MNLTQSEYTEFGWQECHRYEFDDDELLHFAALVAAHERERCAALCDTMSTDETKWCSPTDCANEIRKLT